MTLRGYRSLMPSCVSRF